MTLMHPSGPAQRGLTLIELMIAITISMIVLAALTAMFVTSSRARDEITRANQQIENGRYAMQILSDDLRLAGFMGKADLRDPLDLGGTPALSFSNDKLCGANDLTLAALRDQAPLYIEGANNVASVPGDCSVGSNFVGGTTMSNFKNGTDIVVIRRTSSCAATSPLSASCPPVDAAPYFQVSMCPESPPDVALGVFYKLEACPGSCASSDAARNTVFNLHQRLAGGGCNTASTGFEEIRRYLTHVYYVANIDHDGDAATALVPTLMRAELTVDGGARKFTVVPLAEGIDNLQFLYGIDDAGDDGVPERYEDASGITLAEWQDVVTVKMYILARSTDPSPGHVDDKTYELGTTTIANPGDSFKRHVFESVVQLKNPGGLRQL
jgi:type IV pilus assembly protein PilW